MGRVELRPAGIQATAGILAIALGIEAAALLGARASQVHAREPRLLTELDAVRLDPSWKRVQSYAPNVLMLIPADARDQTEPDTFVAVQYRRITPEIDELRRKLDAGSLAKDDRVGVWRVLSAVPESGCHRMSLTGGPAEDEQKRVRQLWCFNARFALVLIEAGARELSVDDRGRLQAALKRSLLTE
jgi:hypothetical protein